MKLRIAIILLAISLQVGNVGCRVMPPRFDTHAGKKGMVFWQNDDPIAFRGGNSNLPASVDNASSENHLKGDSDDPSSTLLVSATEQDGSELIPVNLLVEESASSDNFVPRQTIADRHIAEPVSALDELPSNFANLTLSEVVRLAITDDLILRSLSGTVIRNPGSVASSLDPDIQRTNANFGVDAALSEFDPVLTGQMSYANNDDYFNNRITTGNAAEVQQDLTRMGLGLNKIGQSGTRYSFNPGLTHDNNNNPSVFFPSSWDSVLEATVQQPLLQGRGRQFNRIAGPNSRPGFFGTSGIEISRVDNDIEYSRFERGLREYVLELVNAYWQLDLAYANYDTIRAARDASFETWQVAKAKFENGLKGGEADREAQARGQYIQIEIQLDQALNAVRSGQAPGVLQAEANLRRLMNLPQSGDELIRPIDSPGLELPHYNWKLLAEEALARRAELREQRQRVERAKLLAIAAKNFTLPRLDAIATYRISGLGDSLIDDGGKFAGALNETFDTNYEEFEFGLNYEAPVGRRRAAAGLRNAHLQSARETALLEEMEQQIVYDLGTSLRSARQTSRTIELATLRRDAMRDAFLARQAAYKADAVRIEDLLEAQRFYLDAELALQTAMTEREQAIYQLASNQGTLLDEFTIAVSE